MGQGEMDQGGMDQSGMGQHEAQSTVGVPPRATGMRQRGMTVLAGGVFVVLFSLLVGQAPVPYVQLQPGPTYDTLGADPDDNEIIVIDGTATSDSAGQLRFLTVGVVTQLTLIEAIAGWLSGDEAVVPRELVYPPDKSDEEVDEENAAQFANSLSAAEAAALAELGYPTVVGILEVAQDSPNADVIEAGDIIVAVDGVEIADPDALLSAIRDKPAGATLEFALTRDGEPVTVQVTTVAGDDGVPRVGFTPEVRSAAPFTIDIPIEGIGGPSAGLMLALGIIDKLTPEDLTGGLIIAGTGTIDPVGNVGAIGGVPQKMIAAKGVGATVFLAPAENCGEAVANAQPGLMIVRVDTLHTALAALATLRDGGVPMLCPGASP
jgi:PDZ domain-containing protein